MTTDPAAMKPHDLVWVYSNGSYYPGEVTQVTDKRVHVTYTAGSGAVKQKDARHSPMDEALGYPIVVPRAYDQPRPAGARQSRQKVTS